EWFLSLFADPTLNEMEDGYRTINALAGPVKRDPNRWIPIISRLIGHDDRNVHNAAAGCLAQFVDRLVNKRARKDALLPLLPWLSDPEWAITKGICCVCHWQSIRSHPENKSFRRCDKFILLNAKCSALWLFI